MCVCSDIPGGRWRGEGEGERSRLGGLLLAGGCGLSVVRECSNDSLGTD